MSAHRVVIVGGGFGGLQAARGLRRAGVEITLVDRRNFHLFQPLTYQVATGALSPGEVAYPLRAVFRRDRNVRVLLAEVERFDLERREVVLRSVSGLPAPEPVPYDTLVVAGGSRYSYFGHDEWSAHAAEVKSLESALTVRSEILAAYEAAELERDPDRREEWLTFVVVGAGPTGVEMAGQIAELAHRTLPGQYRRIDPKQSRIILVDALDAVLPTFGDHLSTKALRQLHKMGVEVELGTKVVDVDATGIEVETKNGRRRIESMTKIWAAGVAAPALSRQVAAAAGAETDRAGRIKVNPDCTLPGHPEIFAVGDMMALDQLPGVAQVAIQSGRYAARQITRRARGEGAEGADKPFKYFDKGSMATISRFSAVASIGKARFAGFIAWLLWLVVHLLYLVGFKNRLTTVLHWFVSFIGRGRSERVATVQQVFARNAMKELGEPPA